MSHIELAFLGIIIGLLGVSGGKLWAGKRIDLLREEFHAFCKHNQCKPERIRKEFELESSIKELIIRLDNHLQHAQNDRDTLIGLLDEQKMKLAEADKKLDTLIVKAQ